MKIARCPRLSQRIALRIIRVKVYGLYSFLHGTIYEDFSTMGGDWARSDPQNWLMNEAADRFD